MLVKELRATLSLPSSVRGVVVGHSCLTYGPAISRQAAKGLRETVRRQWHLRRRTSMNIAELVEMMNPVLRGWISYYGRFRPSALVAALRNINPALRLWARRKYKRFKKRPQAAAAWVHRISTKEPRLFAHWELPGLNPTATAKR